ncbi:hypothetical protein BDW74DRAFT_109444 [Aspergillus multicolor]|uniref:uncharacterized protein n=1 Tax=Aspergillus multicolor TaxID=41759 RepID=UPI003CCD7DD9
MLGLYLSTLELYVLSSWTSAINRVDTRVTDDQPPLWPRTTITTDTAPCLHPRLILQDPGTGFVVSRWNLIWSGVALQ